MTLKNETLLQLIPRDFQYLTQQKKLQYQTNTQQGIIHLKTEYLIDIISHFMKKYFYNCKQELNFGMHSLLLKQKYGEHYNFYMDWLLSQKFLFMVSNYYSGVKTKTYQINNIFLSDVIRYKSSDKLLIKKTKKYLLESISDGPSPILIDVRKKLVDNLQYINIDHEGASAFLDTYFDRRKGSKDIEKYKKNKQTIDDIKAGDMYFVFDTYGRFHTNYTVLKRELRKNFLTINNERLGEIDIKNSQPYFLALYMKQIDPAINGSSQNYFDLVKNGLIYEDIMERSIVKDRDDAKDLMIKVLFDNQERGDHKWENAIFKELYPSIHAHIKEMKAINHKECAHKLQRLESDFLMNIVIKEIITTYPELIFFTVHDSIMYPISYDTKVKDIFYKHKKELDKVLDRKL